MNLLNYFNTFDGLPDTVDNCTLGVGGDRPTAAAPTTRPSSTGSGAKTVAAILAIDADVLGVNEIENDGYGPTSAIAATSSTGSTRATAPGTYAFIDADAAPARSTRSAPTRSRSACSTSRPWSRPSARRRRSTPSRSSTAATRLPRSRPSLAQAFRVNATGGAFVADVNHLKSKGSACTRPGCR